MFVATEINIFTVTVKWQDNLHKCKAGSASPCPLGLPVYRGLEIGKQLQYTALKGAKAPDLGLGAKLLIREKFETREAVLYQNVGLLQTFILMILHSY